MIHDLSSKVLIYGTGKLAKELMKACYALDIVGILDGMKQEGNFFGFPILSWRDVQANTADTVIIAADKSHIREIYCRILPECNSRKLSIFDYAGVDLRCKFSGELLWDETDLSNEYSYEALVKSIEDHDVISFDIFDTLLMRHCLDPLDVFEITAERIEERTGKNMSRFAEKRRTADLESQGGDIEKIYYILSKREGWDADFSKAVIEEERKCEYKTFLSRRTVKKALETAINLGKRVYLISDMYYPKDILAGFLSANGIDGYKDIFVSCEYGCSKGNGLYEIYKKQVPGEGYLHIGDQPDADYKKALSAGLDAFRIRSPIESLRRSSLRRVLEYTNTESDRRFVGDMMAELFNDPFAYASDNGFVSIKNTRTYVKYFIVPVVMCYMERLCERLREGDYDRVIFSARDGYLFKNLYDSSVMGIDNEILPKSEYLFCSRRLAIRAGMRNRTDVEELLNFYSGEKEPLWRTVKKLFGDWINVEIAECSNEEVINLILNRTDEILRQSSNTRDIYKEYCENLGMGENVLFCDLNSQGTVHCMLERIMDKPIDGFYMQWVEGRARRNLKEYSLYDETDEIGDLTERLEGILSSDQPSVSDISGDGDIVFSNDKRNKKQIDTMLKVQDIMVEEIKDYIAKNGRSIPSRELSQVLFSMTENVRLTGEATELLGLYSYNDLGGTR